MTNGLLIDLNKESVRLVMKGNDSLEKSIKNKEERYHLNKTKLWFERNPKARELGLALLNHLNPEEAQEIFQTYLRYSEDARAAILERMTGTKEQEKPKQLVFA